MAPKSKVSYDFTGRIKGFELAALIYRYVLTGLVVILVGVGGWWYLNYSANL